MDSLTDGSVDAANIAVGNSAPRVTEGDIRANIVGEYYFTALDGEAGRQALAQARADGLKIVDGLVPEQLVPVCVVKAHHCLSLLTICVLITASGFMVVGTSAPASPENFNAELGRKFARENAVKQLWPLMGYNLRQRLHEADAVPSARRFPDVLPVAVVDPGTDGIVRPPVEVPPDPVPPPPGGAA